VGKGLTGRHSPHRKPRPDVELWGTGRPTSLRGIATTLREECLRKRVYLKSPVRENRTPGSVGGGSRETGCPTPMAAPWHQMCYCQLLSYKRSIICKRVGYGSLLVG